LGLYSRIKWVSKKKKKKNGVQGIYVPMCEWLSGSVATVAGDPALQANEAAVSSISWTDAGHGVRVQAKEQFFGRME
jgi:hypothetical protein